MAREDLCGGSGCGVSDKPSASMSIALPGVDFAQMAREAIAVKLTEALVGADQAIVGIVASALERRVDDKGQISNYRSDNNLPYIEWLAQDLIRKAALDVLMKKIDALRPQIEEAIDKQLRKDSKKIATMLAESFAASAKSQHYVSFKIEMSGFRRDC